MNPNPDRPTGKPKSHGTTQRIIALVMLGASAALFILGFDSLPELNKANAAAQNIEGRPDKTKVTFENPFGGGDVTQTIDSSGMYREIRSERDSRRMMTYALMGGGGLLLLGAVIFLVLSFQKPSLLPAGGRGRRRRR